MLRTQLAFLALLPALALGWAACTGVAETDEDAIAEEGTAMVAPRTGLFGTFRGTPTALGGVALLVLKSDGTYHRARLIAYTTTQFGPEDDGIYHVTSREGTSLLTLYSNRTDVVDRYRYALSGDTLRLMAAGQRYWMTLERTPDAAWCGVPPDCGLQNLPIGPCAGTWYCGATTCDYLCRSPL
jgi:hypothetical protein